MFHVHVLLWTAERVVTQLRVDADPTRRRRLRHRRRAAVVSD